MKGNVSKKFFLLQSPKQVLLEESPKEFRLEKSLEELLWEQFYCNQYPMKFHMELSPLE